MDRDAGSLGRLLEWVEQRSMGDPSLPPQEGTTKEALLGLMDELLTRRWIEVKAQNRGGGALLSVVDPRITSTGEHALGDLRRSSFEVSPVIADGEQATVEELRTRRFEFAHALYRQTQGNTRTGVNLFEIGEGLGWDQAQAFSVATFLEAEGLLRYVAMGGAISITHAGVKEVELAMRQPDGPTEHFAPTTNNLYVQHMHNSMIQQGGQDNVQQGILHDPDAMAGLAEILGALRGMTHDLQMSHDDQTELTAEIGTVESQLGSSRPRTGLMKESLGRIVGLLSGAVVIADKAQQLADYVDKLRQFVLNIR